MASNPFTSAGLLDPSIQADQASIDRQAALAQMLRQQSLSPIDSNRQIGGVAYRVSPLEGLAKMLQAYSASKLDQNASAGREQLRQQGVIDAQRFAEALRGRQAVNTPANEMDSEAVNIPAKAPDTNEAMMIALQSQSPQLSQLGGALLGGMVPKPDKWGTEPRYDQQGNAYLVSEQGNVRQLPGVKARDKVEVANGQAYNPYQTAPGTTFQPQANPYENLAVPGPNGTIVPNQPVIDAKKAISAAGKTDVNVKVDNKLGESLAGQVGPLIANSHQAAIGAQAAIVNADNIIKALDSNKAITGPGATFRLRAAQIGQAFGMGGNGTAEEIAKTREIIQGLAQSTLAARKQLAGQGQVSDNEGKLLERASSGDINDMTPAEIRVVVGVNKRLAERQIQLHNQLVSKTRANPTTAPLADFFDLSSTQAPAQVNPSEPGRVVDFGSLR